MKEQFRETPPEDIAEIPRIQKDFSNNTTGLYNAMIKFNPNNGVAYLGNIRTFGFIYDGVMLSVGNLEMDEEGARKLRDAILGKNYEYTIFGNPLGTPEQIPVKYGEEVRSMWSVPLDFIHWHEHFTNTPDVVFDSLDNLSKRLQEYVKTTTGLDPTNIDILRNIRGYKEPEVDLKRLTINNPKSLQSYPTETPTIPSNPTKKLNFFKKFTRLGRKK